MSFGIYYLWLVLATASVVAFLPLPSGTLVVPFCKSWEALLRSLGYCDSTLYITPSLVTGHHVRV